MGFLDKAKEAISNAAERIKDPDGTIVEDTWPAGEDPEPGDTKYAQEDSSTTKPVQDADPELDASLEDQYDEEDD
ncbi:hypothetical protein AUR04nite_05660 [Glutamicibacter uratoxydans]|uniref:Uncharacterized protein n=1 Tax=Glutamicibacter uratoxydans TaxID=43667 RepID=A0A4Y4DME6_GLUUR|nr:hypothetical protein [Glutamicibacter uratoxydans]GED05034.1 hypothetical protein AUR04nite_05660 [Glutamicibacter uratoxydans]